jgi:polynucleotide 5'-kinase involved in rRNA processing
LEKTADFAVVNTDGWVEGEEAVKYKTQLAEEIKPDVVLCIQQKDELKPLLAALEKFVKTAVESSLAVRQRSTEKRKNLRELSYAKYLIGAKVKSLPLNQLTIEEKNVSIRQSENKGLLAGLYDSQGKFLGIGVLREVDHLRKMVRVLTSVSAKPSVIALGKVRLDENLREIPTSLGENSMAWQAKI